jgi:hypothetical protein
LHNTLRNARVESIARVERMLAPIEGKNVRIEERPFQNYTSMQFQTFSPRNENYGNTIVKFSPKKIV